MQRVSARELHRRCRLCDNVLSRTNVPREPHVPECAGNIGNYWRGCWNDGWHIGANYRCWNDWCGATANDRSKQYHGYTTHNRSEWNNRRSAHDWGKQHHGRCANDRREWHHWRTTNYRCEWNDRRTAHDWNKRNDRRACHNRSKWDYWHCTHNGSKWDYWCCANYWSE